MNVSDYVHNKFFHNKIGVMVEVGAAGPSFLSQSLLFRQKGWRCICVEPNPFFTAKHRELQHEIYEYACSDSNQDNVDFEIVYQPSNNITYESFSSLKVSDDLIKISGYASRESLKIDTIKVKTRTLNYILEEANKVSPINKIDYLCLDVEGGERVILKEFNFVKYSPKVIVMENNFPYLDEDCHKFMENYNYTFDNKLETNLIYVAN